MPHSNKFLQRVQELYDWTIDIRRKIHRKPELAFEEYHTSELIRSQLDLYKISYQYPIAKTGIVASIGTGQSPVIALRADMDALPLFEETQLEYKSEFDGKMHACGHDCHTAMLLTAARILKEYESEIKGTIKFIFQPAEEGAGGANKMIEEGILQSEPMIQELFALHVSPYIPTGTIASKAGVIMAGASFFDIDILVKGTHAGIPHLSSDSILIASELTQSLQGIVSREINALEPNIISVTSINTNETYNVIPQKVNLKGTCRSFSEESLHELEQKIITRCEAFEQVHNCQINYRRAFVSYPPTINDKKSWELAKKSMNKIFEQKNIIDFPAPLMLAEDFANYLLNKPGCFSFLGCKNESIGFDKGLHHPQFTVDESVLSLGVLTHIHVALDYINNR